RDDLGGGGPVDQVTDPADDVAGLALLLCEQRGVRGGAGEDPPAGDLLDFLDGPRIYEELHRASDDDRRLIESRTRSISCGKARSTLVLSITATPSSRAHPARCS